ncbi:MAG: peptide chain release factor 2 [Clostridium sp.]|nr:peptide chain release factor 2 [Clostridium sp.]
MLVKMEECLSLLKVLREDLQEIRVSLDLTSMRNRIEELENNMQESGFWDDMSRAQEVTQEDKFLKDRINAYNSMSDEIKDIEEMLKMCEEEEDEETLEETLSEAKELYKKIDKFRIEILLADKYDKNSAILDLHTGAGGTDAQDWTEMLLRMYTRWAQSKGFKVETLDMLPGDEAGIKSVTLKISGDFAYGYLKAEKGIHRLVRISPFNANGKRQTSFASVEVLPELTQKQNIEIKSDDLRIDTYRSSGAGGQHVNKTESAIRITHIPTGIVVQCQNERSQHSNKETAMEMLKAKLVELKERAHKEKIEDLTGELKEIGWGSQIRSYVFQPYTMVKDHRTGIQTSNIDSVMDGDIDEFINGFLKQKSK